MSYEIANVREKKRSIKSFMQWLVDGPDARIDAARVAIVVAHPDDETIGCGGVLQLLSGVNVIVVTNGSPRNANVARRFGFVTPNLYAAARSAELRSALALAQVAGAQIIEIGVHDGGVWQNLSAICRQLAVIFIERRIETVITHAFEGGHSDHDGIALCVHRCSENLGRRRPSLVEMPLYYAGSAGTIHQTFCDEDDEGVALSLGAPQLKTKRAMFNAYKSQSQTLANFEIGIERFRSARVYDFRFPPNGGRLKYPLSFIGANGDDWSARAQYALDEGMTRRRYAPRIRRESAANCVGVSSPIDFQRETRRKALHANRASGIRSEESWR